MGSQWRVVSIDIRFDLGHHHDPEIFSFFIYLVPCHQRCLCGSLLNVDNPITKTDLIRGPKQLLAGGNCKTHLVIY
jgi:hypothetical protein